MPRFDDLVNQQLSKAREAAAIQESADKLLKNEETASRLKAYQQAVEELQQRPEYKRITEFFNDPQLRGAIDWMFKRYSFGSERDQEPQYLLPSIPEDAVTRSINEISVIKQNVLSHIIGRISFKAGFWSWRIEGESAPDGGPGIPIGDSGWIEDFHLSVKSNFEGNLFIQTKDSFSRAHDRYFTEYKVDIAGHHAIPLSSSSEEGYEKLAWIPIQSTEQALEILAKEFAQAHLNDDSQFELLS